MPVAATPRHVTVRHVMGTAVSLDVRGAAPEPADVDAAFAVLEEADARFSTYRADSEVRRIDRGDLTRAGAHPDVRAVLDRCDALHAQTGGFFDAHATGRLDPSALVKGWALQRAADVLRARGVARFCLTGGGDVVARGGGWRIGIQHPEDRGAVCAVVPAGDLAVATSGLYERGDHIRDPRGGGAPRGLRSVTVTGPDLGTADALSTAIFAMGAGGPAWSLGLPAGYAALCVRADDVVLTTPGFPGAGALTAVAA